MQTNIVILPSLPYIWGLHLLLGGFICGIMHAANTGNQRLWTICLHHFQNSFAGVEEKVVCPLGTKAGWYEKDDLSREYTIVMVVMLTSGFLIGCVLSHCARISPRCR